LPAPSRGRNLIADVIMKPRFLIALLLVATIAFAANPSLLDWTVLPPVRDVEGIAGSFAGVSDGRLIGGGDARGDHDRVMLLSAGANDVAITALPSLPQPCANHWPLTRSGRTALPTCFVAPQLSAAILGEKDFSGRALSPATGASHSGDFLDRTT